MIKLDANWKWIVVFGSSNWEIWGVKQGCPLAPTLFAMCIDKWEEIVNKVAKEEWLDGPNSRKSLSLYS